MNLSDPILWICAGILLFGVIFLIWAIGKLRGPGSAEGSGDILSEIGNAEYTDIDLSAESSGGLSLNFPSLGSSPARSAPAPAPMSKDIADRLENMTQRLTEMQTVLSKQTAASSMAAGGAPGSPGPGFSGETIDKLLKIIGNVIQQVDILQRSLNVSKPEGAAPAPKATPAAKLVIETSPSQVAAKPAAGTSTPPETAPKTPPAMPKPRIIPVSPMGPLSAVRPVNPASGAGPASKPPSGPAKQP